MNSEHQNKRRESGKSLRLLCLSFLRFACVAVAVISLEGSAWSGDVYVLSIETSGITAELQSGTVDPRSMKSRKDVSDATEIRKCFMEKPDHTENPDHYLELKFDRFNDRDAPTLKNVTDRVPEFLRLPSEDDIVIAWVSLQGYETRDVKTGLMEASLILEDFSAVPNSEGKMAVMTMSWLRDALLASRARQTLLLLDVNHAGSIASVGGAPGPDLSTRTLEVAFRQRDAKTPEKMIYVISSRADGQPSYYWEEKHQSLFSFWIQMGLRGAADENGDTIISADELTKFVRTEVPLTAAEIGSDDPRHMEQTPVRFLLGADSTDFPLKAVLKKSAKESFDEVTQLIDLLIRNHLPANKGLRPRIGVLEFPAKVDLGNGTSGADAEIRGKAGSLGAVARDFIERNLAELRREDSQQRSPHAYEMVQLNSFQDSLQDMRLDDVYTAALNRVQNQVDALVVGDFMRVGNGPGQTGPDRLILNIQLIELQENQQRLPDVLGSISATILVNEELWMLLGGSGVFQPKKEEDKEPNPPSDEDAPLIAPAPERVAIEKQPDILKYTVWTGSAGTKLQPAKWLDSRSSEPVFGVRQGDEFGVRIQNPSDQWLAMVATVDGFNVIGHRGQFPHQARYWLIPPKGAGMIDQWLSGEDEITETKEKKPGTLEMKGTSFLVTDVRNSVAAQHNLTGNLGEIRLMLFETKVVPGHGISRSADGLPVIGIGEGRAQGNRFPLYQDREIDYSKPLCNYVLRYVELSGTN